jgi:nitrate/nitrite transport system ATP-binding protein
MNDRFLELWQITKSFPGPAGPVTIVRDFDLFLHKGEFVSLIGHSGCGKSTVLSIAAGLLEATSGGVTIAGREISGAGPDRGVVFQAPCLLPWLTAHENVRLGVDEVFGARSSAFRADLAAHYLELVGLADEMDKKPAALSAGMRQRVGIARAFALDPQVLLLDEPFGMLDSLTRYELQEVLVDLWSKDEKTALMVTHDVDEALFLSDRVAMMTSGPEARLGGALDIPFPRPRRRREVMEHPAYYPLREEIITFLEGQAQPDEDPGPAPTPEPPIQNDARVGSPA